MGTKYHGHHSASLTLSFLTTKDLPWKSLNIVDISLFYRFAKPIPKKKKNPHFIHDWPALGHALCQLPWRVDSPGAISETSFV